MRAYAWEESTMASELLDIKEVCAFFGGSRPLNAATIYRNLGTRFPRPVKVGANSARWLRSECEEALTKIIAARDGAEAA
jgi:predicted DNA-binding transcriptional regulator AlpA